MEYILHLLYAKEELNYSEFCGLLVPIWSVKQTVCECFWAWLCIADLGWELSVEMWILFLAKMISLKLLNPVWNHDIQKSVLMSCTNISIGFSTCYTAVSDWSSVLLLSHYAIITKQTRIIYILLDTQCQLKEIWRLNNSALLAIRKK